VKQSLYPAAEEERFKKRARNEVSMRGNREVNARARKYVGLPIGAGTVHAKQRLRFHPSTFTVHELFD
jgi:hypothetical protein